MHWALVIYSLSFLTADGRPEVATFHPMEKAQCLSVEAEQQDQLRQNGYVGVCQQITPTVTPVWPWRPSYRAPQRPQRG